MGTRSVRLDKEAESALTDIVDRTGLSISDAIKQGLITYREKALSMTTKTPSQFFRDFDLGHGGYSFGAARDSKRLLKEKLHSKRSNR